jgi:arabinofuranosyltransferase
MDAILLVLPALAYAWWTRPDRRRTLLPAAAGFSPLIAWLLFAFWYYGFPFPNTAYAKLKTGVGAIELIRCGVHYFRNSRRTDPVTLAVIGGTLLPTAAAWLYGARSRWRASARMWNHAAALAAVAGGIVLYFAYTLKIGGDYMSGRFFAAPLLLAAIILAAFGRGTAGPRRVIAWVAPSLAAGAVLCVALARANSPLRAGRYYEVHTPVEALVDEYRISDERGVYFADLGLFHAPTLPPGRGWGQLLRHNGEAQRSERPAGNVALIALAGVWCYYGPRDLHYLDVFALCDPLLAHLPPPYDPGWRVGHLRRSLPLGYFETLVSGRNQVADPNLAVYYDKIRLVSRGPLFSLTRLREAVKLNLGRYEPLIDYDYYRHPDFLPETSPGWSPEKGWPGIVLPPPRFRSPPSPPTSSPGSRP